MKKLKPLLLPVTVLALLACNRTEENLSPISNSNSLGLTLEAFPGQKGEIKEGLFLGAKIKYEEIGEYKVWDGDILLSDEQLTAKANGRTQAAGITGYYSDKLNSGYRWPGNVVYYTIDPAFSNPAIVTAAIAKVHSQTNVRFVPRTTEPDYVYIFNGTGNYSQLGAVKGKQNLSLTTQAHAGIALHELGHAIGILHEHNRADRDTYLNVNLNNADPNYSHNFNIHDRRNGVDYGAFDFSSVMLYGSYNFSINGNAVLTKKDGSVFTSILYSPTASFSAGDVALINAMYPAWVNIPGGATDIGVGANGTICVIGTNSQVYRWNGTAWTSLAALGSSIDVDTLGNPWIVNSANAIYKFNGSSWEAVPGAAKDISIGADGSMYVIGASNGVFKWTGSGWTSLGRAASRITTDANGNAWIVNPIGRVWVYNSNSGGWSSAANPKGKAKDIGAGPSGVYITNTDGEILKYGNNKWFLVNGTATVIDGGVSGASVVNASGSVYTF